MPTSLETRYAETIRQLGLLPDARIQQAQSVADALRKRNIEADLRTVLIGRRILDAEAADQVLEKMGGVAVFCPTCHAQFSADAYQAASPPLCPHDNTPVKPTLAVKKGADGKPLTRRRKARQEKPVTHANDPLIGKRFGEFELTGMLAKDAVARSYLARFARATDENQDDLFIVKVATAVDRTTLRRFQREAKYAGLVRHPNIVEVIDSGEQEDRFYLVTEYIGGNSLDQVIAENGGRLMVEYAVDIAARVLDGLEAAHQFGVVHRNIKPTTVMVSGSDVKVVGFGSARLTDEDQQSEQLTARGQSLGTLHYMPPEQLQSSKVGFRADLYGLGSTLFHMLCGRPPYEGREVITIIKAKATQDAPPPSSINQYVPRELDAVMAKLLARVDRDRPESAAAAAEELRALIS